MYHISYIDSLIHIYIYIYVYVGRDSWGRGRGVGLGVASVVFGTGKKSRLGMSEIGRVRNQQYDQPPADAHMQSLCLFKTKLSLCGRCLQETHIRNAIDALCRSARPLLLSRSPPSQELF